MKVECPRDPRQPCASAPYIRTSTLSNEPLELLLEYKAVRDQSNRTCARNTGMLWWQRWNKHP